MSCQFDKEIYTLFLDFKSQYTEKKLINILKEFQFPSKLINLVTISVMKTMVIVKIRSSTSDPIIVKLKLRQSNTLSHTLFNMLLEKNDTGDGY